MREIKFRAWNTKQRSMSPLNDLLCAVDWEDDCLLGYLISSQQYDDGLNIPSNGHSADWLLMQYTGLKDKNGVEIYEGDVVRCNHRKDPIVIEFLDRHAMFGYQYKHLKYYLAPFTDSPTPITYEVIGNIYENPELLEELS